MAALLFLAFFNLSVGLAASVPLSEIRVNNLSPKNVWPKLRAPAALEAGKPTVMGAYSAGCVRGAVELPRSSKGIELVKVSRRRNFAHPVMAGLLARAGEFADGDLGGPLLVGDISMARGGPMNGGHASHQLGLDADIWFGGMGTGKLVKKGQKLSTHERDHMGPASVVSTTNVRGVNEKRWHEQYEKMLFWMAAQSETDRIFVNPAIKNHLCEKYKGDKTKTDVMRKVRPWFFHTYHFHVRAGCPAGEALCVPSDKIPEGNGCDESLAWWFTPEALEKGLEPGAPAERIVDLPKECAEVAANP